MASPSPDKSKRDQVRKDQIWREVDPRHERHVRVLSLSRDKEIVVIETVIRSADGWVHKPKTRAQNYAGIERFNGKGGGYELHVDAP